MFRLLLFFISFSAFAAPRGILYPGGFQSNFWQQVQIQHLQTQQQLQAQDQYRRNLLLQDQERQIQKLQDQQDQIDFMQRSSMMHQYSDRLKMYSSPLTTKKMVSKKQQK